MTQADKVAQRRKLCEKQKWKCYWCGKPMRWWNSDSPEIPGDAATLDHLDDRWSTERGMHPSGDVRRVAAHKTCNEQRSLENERRVWNEFRERGADEPRSAEGSGTQSDRSD